ncbi:MAG: hypothetical protein Q8L55_11120, partial [Phycisphaerales bacterium]|nr:hypothetical protein [Phycisphaerales bacterium]
AKARDSPLFVAAEFIASAQFTAGVSAGVNAHEGRDDRTPRHLTAAAGKKQAVRAFLVRGAAVGSIEKYS